MRKAFTIIELLVVVSIIALLIAILQPVLSKAKESARITQCAASLQQQGVATTAYAIDNKDALPSVRDDVSGDAAYNLPFGHWSRWFQLSAGENKPKWSIAQLWYGNYFTSAEALYCPSQQDPKFILQSYEPFPSASKLNFSGVRVAYNHNPMTRSLTDRMRRYRSFAQMDSADRMMLGVDLIETANAGSVSLTSHRNASQGDGWNVMWGDGSVRFVRDALAEERIRAATIHNNAHADWDFVLDRLMGGDATGSDRPWYE